SSRGRPLTLTLALLAGSWTGAAREAAADNQGGSTGATRSTPIALTTNDRFVWVVNRDNNSVTVLDVGNDRNRKFRDLQVGIEPRSVAITPDNKTVYVANMVSGTVSVIDQHTFAIVKTIQVGTEPVGCVLTPDGSKLYVANFSSDDVSVISTATNKVT